MPVSVKITTTAMHDSLCLHPPQDSHAPLPVANTLHLDVGDKGRDLLLDQRFQAVLVKLDRVWPNGARIPYAFVPTFGIPASLTEKRKIRETIDEWQLYGCITFVMVEDPPEARIRVGLNESDGCWSMVGTGVANDQLAKITMNLATVTDEDETSELERSHILHEFGHALGLLHEHQSPARDHSKPPTTDQVYTYFALPENGGWDKKTVDDQILKSLPTDVVTNFSRIDPDSIMAYELPADLSEDLGLGNIAMKRNSKLSDMDKAWMTITYPFLNGVTRPDPAWTLERALDVAGLTEAAAPQVRSLIFKAKDATTIRRLFSDWCMRVRQEEATARLVLGA